MPPTGLSRREMLAALGAAPLGVLGLGPDTRAAAGPLITRPIPSTGERLPVIGMGSWITFDVGPGRRDERLPIMQAFFEAGGAMIDSSPMYGSAQEVIGYCLERSGNSGAVFSTTKVWTPGQRQGIRQMEASRALWGVERFDLMQVHNLVDWQAHLETLAEWKAAGRVRYVGITTSHGRRHAELALIMRERPLDFVQLTYSILDREAEQRLLPLAADRGLGVIVNRPFRRGALIDKFARHPLPDWAGEIDCANWPQFLLKFIVSHPAVTCAIPATSRVDHMVENMGALTGRLPDPATRRRMVGYVESL